MHDVLAATANVSVPPHVYTNKIFRNANNTRSHVVPSAFGPVSVRFDTIWVDIISFKNTCQDDDDDTRAFDSQPFAFDGIGRG